jgi:predicted neutral ceramidase superfamily lipid hydrolase
MTDATKFIDDFPSVQPQHIASTLARATELLVADAHNS